MSQLDPWALGWRAYGFTTEIGLAHLGSRFVCRARVQRDDASMTLSGAFILRRLGEPYDGPYGSVRRDVLKEWMPIGPVPETA